MTSNLNMFGPHAKLPEQNCLPAPLFREPIFATRFQLAAGLLPTLAVVCLARHNCQQPS